MSSAAATTRAARRAAALWWRGGGWHLNAAAAAHYTATASAHSRLLRLRGEAGGSENNDSNAERSTTCLLRGRSCRRADSARGGQTVV